MPDWLAAAAGVPSQKVRGMYSTKCPSRLSCSHSPDVYSSAISTSGLPLVWNEIFIRSIVLR